MKTFAIVLVTIFVTFSVHAADNEITKHEKAAQDFSFEKTKLGTSLAEFKKRFPKAELLLEHKDKKFGVVAYAQLSEAGPVCGYYFFEGRLFKIRVPYTDVDALGGLSGLIERLVEKYGKADGATNDKESSKMTMYWMFSKVNRFIELEATDSLAGLLVVDTKAYDKLAEKKKKSSKLGIDN